MEFYVHWCLHVWGGGGLRRRVAHTAAKFFFDVAKDFFESGVPNGTTWLLRSPFHQIGILGLGPLQCMFFSDSAIVLH